ncbi:hypothetical protein BGX28_007325 [Mortierella sp. GBA30]|nr:hypothetical protein BGX28_007325 [Mortierella sp. GBA30]
MSDLTAAELELEALLESRLEIIAARLQVLTPSTQHLHSEAQICLKDFQAKYKRLQFIEDYLLRLQGKPGLSHLYLEGSQPSSRRYLGIGNSDIEEIKMGVKTLRRKFQAAGVAVSTVGWWRHLKENKDLVSPTAIVAIDAHNINSIMAGDNVPEVANSVQIDSNTNNSSSSGSTKIPAAKLSIDTSITATSTTPGRAVSPTPVKKISPVLSPKAVLSPTSPSTKKRNTAALQQIFTTPITTKPLHEHYVSSPSNQRAHPSLGLFSPPMSPYGPGGEPVTTGNSLMQGLSLRS